jgi:oligopeptide/dipeptide ABC transporter ATP-binding protein
MADRVVVMYAGSIVEEGSTSEIFANPRMPYTIGLLRSVPDPTDDSHAELYQIPGLPPDVARMPPGCPFAPRCARAEAICRDEFPPFVQLTTSHQSLCHFATELYDGRGTERLVRAGQSGDMR